MATSLQLPEYVPFLFFSSILTAIDRGARLTGVPPGLPKRAAAGGATDAHPDLRVAGQTPVSSRTELQVAVAHAVVCGATQELRGALAIVRIPLLEREVTQMIKFKLLYIKEKGCFNPNTKQSLHGETTLLEILVRI